MNAENHRHSNAFQSDESESENADYEEEDFALMEEEISREINENAEKDPDVKAFEKDGLHAWLVDLPNTSGSESEDTQPMRPSRHRRPLQIISGSDSEPDQPSPMPASKSNTLPIEPSRKRKMLRTSLPLHQQKRTRLTNENTDSCASDKSVDIQIAACSPSIAIDASDSDSFPFRLTEAESKLLVPGPLYTTIQGEEYLKHAFGIDLNMVDHRSRKWSGHLGKSRSFITSVSPEQIQDAVPAENLLVEDSDLKAVGCAYLLDYDIIMCRNLHAGKPCSYGVPLANLMAHLYASKSGLSDKTPRTPHHVEFCKRKGKKYNSNQINFLCRILVRYPNVIATMGELRDIQMRPDQFGPIRNIREPSDGFACQECGIAIHVSSSKKFMGEHWGAHRKANPSLDPWRVGDNASKFHSCQVQSFSHDSSSSIWMAVPPEMLGGKKSHTAAASKSFGSIIANSLFSDEPPPQTLNQAIMLPFFRHSGSAAYILPFSPKFLSHLISLPDHTEPRLVHLKTVIVKRFKILCESINAGPTLLRELLVTPKFGEKRMVEKFNCPAKASTQITYALEEVRLVCFVMRCIGQGCYVLKDDDRLQKEKGDFCLTLTKQQLKAFESLSNSLNLPSSGCDWTPIIDNALSTIYMPNNPFEMFKDKFANAVNVYVCLRSVHPQGGFQTPKSLTVYEAKTQFGIRLFLMDHSLRRYEVFKQADPDEKEAQYDAWMREMRETIDRWGTENHISPLSNVREWMRAMSRLARNSPSNNVVTWDLAGDCIRLRNHTVSVSQYHKSIQKSLKALVRHVDTKVLRNVTFPSTATSLPVTDDEDIDTRGHGLFFLSCDGLEANDNPASILLRSLCQAGEVCMRSGDKIIWHDHPLSDWLLDVAGAWSQLYVLLHLLTLPGRGTEEAVWQYNNSAESCRHLFLSPHLKTLVTLSNYNKTTAITGLHKYILRVIPFCLAEVITKLLRIVRPVEMVAVASQIPGNANDVLHIYSTYMFVSLQKVWEAPLLSRLLRSWFERELGVPFGMNLHRHFAQALQRRFLSYEKDSDLAEVANRAMGHGKEVGAMNYARQAGDLLIGISERQQFEQVGADWIRWHGVDVSSRK
ncbi:hypothetical protein C8R48DRAFT_781482 [Suillus tomentosus]|nr:hypothetical protein C8R48DRAFT_781482 [Suillus tomentosus]